MFTLFRLDRVGGGGDMISYTTATTTTANTTDTNTAKTKNKNKEENVMSTNKNDDSVIDTKEDEVSETLEKDDDGDVFDFTEDDEGEYVNQNPILTEEVKKDLKEMNIFQKAAFGVETVTTKLYQLLDADPEISNDPHFLLEMLGVMSKHQGMIMTAAQKILSVSGMGNLPLQLLHNMGVKLIPTDPINGGKLPSSVVDPSTIANSPFTNPQGSSVSSLPTEDATL